MSDFLIYCILHLRNSLIKIEVNNILNVSKSFKQVTSSWQSNWLKNWMIPADRDRLGRSGWTFAKETSRSKRSGQGRSRTASTWRGWGGCGGRGRSQSCYPLWSLCKVWTVIHENNITDRFIFANVVFFTFLQNKWKLRVILYYINFNTHHLY